MTVLRPATRARPAVRAVVLLAIVASCAPALVHPGPEDLRRAALLWPGVTLESLEQGRALYVQSCAGCHHLHLPEELPAEEWPKVIDRMVAANHVDLRPDALEAISRYLIAISARAGRAASPPAAAVGGEGHR